MEKIVNNMKRCIENGLDRTNNRDVIVNVMIVVFRQLFQLCASVFSCNFNVVGEEHGESRVLLILQYCSCRPSSRLVA